MPRLKFLDRVVQTHLDTVFCKLRSVLLKIKNLKCTYCLVTRVYFDSLVNIEL